MSLKARLEQIERRAIEAGFGDGATPCPTCRGPDPRSFTTIIVDVAKGERVPMCPTCGRHVDGSGRHVGMHGGVIVIGERVPEDAALLLDL